MNIAREEETLLTSDDVNIKNGSIDFMAETQ
jgi:hypothetical protein